MKPDFDLAVLGGGTAGLTAAILAAELGARVRAAQAHIAPHDSPERLAALGVEVVADSGSFERPRRLRLASGGALTARTVLVATGSEPALPPIDGLIEAGPLTTDTVWESRALPQRLVVLGGGPVGCELGQAFARLGSRVTIVEMAEHLLPGEDPEAGRLLTDRFAAEGIAVQTGSRCIRVTRDRRGVRLALRTPSGRIAVDGDELLVALGRRPRTAGLRLDAASIRTSPEGSVVVDRRMRTTAREVYAAGDVTAQMPFTHVAAYQSVIATLNAVLSVRRSVSYRAIPYAVFTDPELAHVGLGEPQARARWGGATVVARYNYHDVDRAVTAATPYGFAKLVGDPRGRLVGATVAAPAAGEVIGELAALVAGKAKVGEVFKTVHPYPTFALGPAMAGAAHLRQRFLTERTRRVVRPLLAVRRAASRA